jgi:hypothetical protein
VSASARRAACWAVLGMLASRGVTGVLLSGNVTSTSDWALLAHFRVGAAGGLASGEIETARASVLLLYDEAAWAALHATPRATCMDATQSATLSVPLAGGVSRVPRVSLGARGVWQIAVARAGCGQSDAGPAARRRLGWASGHQHRFRKYNSNRHARYYTSNFSRLGSPVRAPTQRLAWVVLRLHVAVADGGTGWTSEFPADERLLLPLTALFATAFSALSAWALAAERRWSAQPGARFGGVALLPFRAVRAAAALTAGALLLSLAELALFVASGGVERVDKVSLLRLASTLLELCSRSTVALLLPLLGTGWMVCSPRLEQHGLAVARFGVHLALMYLIAAAGSLFVLSGSNFTNEYDGVLWTLVMVSESLLLLFAVASALLSAAEAQGTELPDSASAGASADLAHVASQRHARAVTLRAVAAIAAQVLLTDWVVAGMARQDDDDVLLVSMLGHLATLTALVALLRPERLSILHSTRAAARAPAQARLRQQDRAAVVAAAAEEEEATRRSKARLYGEAKNLEDDFEQIRPLIE